MNKAVKIVLLVILLIILIIIALLVIAGIYFYYFHVFKEIKICISEQATDIPYECTTDRQCMDLLDDSLRSVRSQMENAPVSIKTYINSAIDKAVYCDNTCKIKSISSNMLNESITDCNPSDEELSFEIRGKEGIELLKYFYNNREQLNTQG